MVRLGLFLDDHLGGRKLLPASQAIDLRRYPAGAPLAAGLRRAFVYSDCWVQDSRLVVLNALDAAERGAEVLTRSEEHTSELQSLMHISYAVFCLKKKKTNHTNIKYYKTIIITKTNPTRDYHDR